MAISQTSFDQRLSRINSGQTTDVAAEVGQNKSRRSIRARCLTFPFMLGVGILTGGTAYAFAAAQPEMQWVMALAG